MSVLLIDDDQDDCELFCEAVKSINSDAYCVALQNAPVAIERVMNGRIAPDIIFLDVNMPRMNGRECLTALKDDGNFNLVPIVMYSTSVDPAEINYFKSRGVDYISKPNSFSDLILLLQPFLSRQTVL